MLTRPRLTRAAGVTAVAALALLTLSACISVKADMTINGDAKATGTLSLEFEKQAANFLGITSLADFESGVSDDKTTEGLSSLQDCSASENDTAYIYSCTFADQEFANTGDAPWTITKQGDTIVMKVVNEGQSADSGSGDLLGDASLGSISISATFPGPITDVTGAGATKTSDTTVQVDASLTDSVDVTVTSQVSSASNLMSVLAIVAIIVVIGVIALAIIVLIMRRRGRGSDAVVEPAAAAVVTDTLVAETAVAEAVVAETEAGEQVVETQTVAMEPVIEDATAVVEPVTEDVPAPDKPASDDPSI